MEQCGLSGLGQGVSMWWMSAGRQPKRKTVSLDKLDSKILHDYVDGKTELPSYVKLPMVAGADDSPVTLNCYQELNICLSLQCLPAGCTLSIQTVPLGMMKGKPLCSLVNDYWRHSL